jgi:hypothetical protein
MSNENLMGLRMLSRESRVEFQKVLMDAAIFEPGWVRNPYSILFLA